MIKYINDTNPNPVPDLFIVLSESAYSSNTNSKVIANEDSICSEEIFPIIMLDCAGKKIKTIMVIKINDPICIDKI